MHSGTYFLYAKYITSHVLLVTVATGTLTQSYLPEDDMPIKSEQVESHDPISRVIPRVSSPQVEQAQTQLELYQKIFGQTKKTAMQTIMVNVSISGREEGEVQVLVNHDSDDIKLAVQDVMAILVRFLMPEKLTLLEQSLQGQLHITPDWLNKQGIETLYDSSKLSLALVIPASQRQVETISFQRVKRNGTDDDVIRPSPFSAYMNVYTEKDYFQDNNMPDHQSTNVALDSAFNFYGWVLEAEGFYQDEPITQFRRGDVRLVKDLVPLSMRTAVGDVALPATGFQNPHVVGGGVIEKNFTLQPDLMNQSMGQKQFILEHPSTVEIFINEQYYKTLHLSTGRYDLRDFPIASGVNDVRITITDNFGRIRELNFPLFADNSLLSKDLHEYRYGMGYLVSGINHEYDTTQPVFSGFHRLGYTENMTLGVNLQATSEQQLYGAEMRTVNRWGKFTVNAAMSRNAEEHVGSAATFTYGYQGSSIPNHQQRLWEVSTTFKSRYFQAPGDMMGSEPVLFDINAGVSQSLSSKARLALRGRYQESHFGRATANDMSVFFHQRLSSQMTWDMSLSRNESFSGESGYGLSAHFSYNFGERRQHLVVSYDAPQHNRSVTWHQRPEKVIGGMDTELELKDKKDTRSLSGSLQYHGHRVETNVRHTVTSYKDEPQEESQHTNMRFATALVYAAGQFGLSRPVTDSFAIIVPHRSLEDSLISVDAQGESYQAQSDFLGPAVVADLAAYRSRFLALDVADLPVGYDIGDGLSQVIPTYRSGVVIPLGSDANVILKGVLTTNDDKPLALQSGSIVPWDKPDTEIVMFFTNRNGHFLAAGLKPGQYRLQLNARNKQSLMIEIPDNTEGIYDVGTLRYE